MSKLHTGYGFVPGLLLLLVTPLWAAPFAGPGYAANCGLDIQRSADANAYFLEIGFDSEAAPDIAVQLRGRLLRVQVRQGAARRDSACRMRINRTLTLPRDADPGRMQRQDETGRVLLVIPRRQPYWR